MYVSSLNIEDIPQEVAYLALQWSPSPVLLLDRDSVVRYANKAALNELRSTPSQLIGMRFIDLLDEGSHAKSDALLANAGETPGPLFEINQIAGDGDVVLVGYRAVRLPPVNNTASVLLLGTSMSDVVAITERLVALNRRLHALFRITSGASRSTVLTNVLEEVLEITVAELELRAGLVLLAPNSLDTSLISAGSSANAWHLAAHYGFPGAFAEQFEINHQLVEVLSSHVDRKQLILRGDDIAVLGLRSEDLDRSFGPLYALAAVPMESDDRLLGWLLLLADRYRAFEGGTIETLHTIGNLLGPIVSNARYYAALRETSAQLSAVLDGIESGVMLVDRAGIVRYANARLGRLFNTNVKDWPGKPRSDVLQLPLNLLERDSAAYGGDILEWQGTPRRVLSRIIDDVFDSAGVLLGTIEVYTDVTHIEDANRLKDEFVAAAAHDLKTPVTAIKGYAQIGLRLAHRIDQPRLVQYLDMVNNRSDQLAYLMDSLLDVSRIQGGRLRLEVEPLIVQDLITKVVQYFEFDLQRQQRMMHIDQPHEPLHVEWDMPRMERVLINLISNAIKYSPVGQPIELAVRLLRGVASDRDEIEITVTDHGIGIPEDERVHVFDRFYRVRQTIDEGYKGTGLGLYICRSVVESHHGRIWAEEARHGGSGTTMVVRVPTRTAG